MIDSVLSAPCVVFALDREALGFRARFPFRQRISSAPCRAWLAGHSSRLILTLEAGIGQKSMARAVAWAMSKPVINNEPYLPPSLALAGFSGALESGLEPGDLVLATSVVDAQGNEIDATLPNRDLPNVRQGKVVTVDFLVSAPKLKRELGERHRALAVDMESFTAARLCREHNVPFVCLRAISDDIDMPLSADLVSLMSSGRPSIRKVVTAILRRPSIMRELLKLARNTRHAAERLGETLATLLVPERLIADG